jgi:hypothetical protein
LRPVAGLLDAGRCARKLFAWGKLATRSVNRCRCRRRHGVSARPAWSGGGAWIRGSSPRKGDLGLGLGPGV